MSRLTDFILDVSLITGAKMSCVLNPSSTESSMKSVASVLQSIEERSAFDGGVMKSEIAAARTDTRSIGSFLMNAIAFCIFVSLK